MSAIKKAWKETKEFIEIIVLLFLFVGESVLLISGQALGLILFPIALFGGYFYMSYSSYKELDNE